MNGEMILRGAFQSLALKLQEAFEALGANDVRTRLGDCVRAHFRGSGTWGYYLDHIGDDASGDVIYSCESDVCRTSYTIEPAAGGAAAKCTIDFEGSVKVVPRTVYELDAEEAAHYATMEESLKTEKLYTELPLYERRITKSEREAASADDFAGKGRSFPILKRGDVDAAINSMARAGASNHTEKVLKGRIASIAKRKGWESALPKSWRTEKKASEAAPPAATEGAIVLKESAGFPIDIVLSEALTPGKKIKLIAPGKGSTAYYTAEALKQAATDKVFKAGTPMRIDHPTMAEEAARPEGSVKDWGAVLALDAYWLDEHPEGPGLFSEIKPFSDHATLITEKAPYAGVSIRANGFAVMEGGKPLLREGVPVLSKFTFAEGVDMVTRAGAGGMFLSEAARPAADPIEGGPLMDAAELKKLQESQVSLAATNARLLERALRGDARELAASILKPLTLHEAIKCEVVNNVLKGALPLVEATGELDTAKWTELVNAEAKRLGEVASQLLGSGRPAGMGAPAPVIPIDATEAARRATDAKRLRESAVRNFMDMGQSQAAAEASADRMLQEDVAC